VHAMQSGQHCVTDEDISSFRRHGFVVLRGFLTPNDLVLLRSAMETALLTFRQSPNSYDVTAAADAF